MSSRGTLSISCAFLNARGHVTLFQVNIFSNVLEKALVKGGSQTSRQYEQLRYASAFLFVFSAHHSHLINHPSSFKAVELFFYVFCVQSVARTAEVACAWFILLLYGQQLYWLNLCCIWECDDYEHIWAFGKCTKYIKFVCKVVLNTDILVSMRMMFKMSRCSFCHLLPMRLLFARVAEFYGYRYNASWDHKVA